MTVPSSSSRGLYRYGDRGLYHNIQNRMCAGIFKKLVAHCICSGRYHRLKHYRIFFVSLPAEILRIVVLYLNIYCACVFLSSVCSHHFLVIQILS